MSTSGPLSGYRVLDLGRVLAAPWATQVLADFGAEVIKVERPGRGDDARLYGPATLKDADGKRTLESAFHLAGNRNKRSITVDMSTPEGQEIIRALAVHSDVLLENFIAGGLARYGLDYESLRKINPRLVYCSLTGYGQWGPYANRPGYDAVFQAQGGLMNASGLPDGVPGGGAMKTGPSLMDVTTGYFAAMGILAALLHRDRVSGEGQHVDVALMDVSVALQTEKVQAYLLTGEQPPRQGNAQASAPANAYPCADGLIYVSAGADKDFARLSGALGLAADTRFETSAGRDANRADLDVVIAEALAGRTRAEVCSVLVEADVPCAPVQIYDEVFADPHVRARGVEMTIDHPLQPGLRLIANPIRMSRGGGRAVVRPPLLGEHTEAVLEDLVRQSKPVAETATG